MPGRAQAGHDQVAPLQVRVLRGRRGTARWSTRSSRSGAVRCRPSAARSSRPPGRRSRVRVGVDHGQRIVLLAGRVEGGDIGELLGRRGDGIGRGAVKGGILVVRTPLWSSPAGLLTAILQEKVDQSLRGLGPTRLRRTGSLRDYMSIPPIRTRTIGVTVSSWGRGAVDMLARLRLSVNSTPSRRRPWRRGCRHQARPRRSAA